MRKSLQTVSPENSYRRNTLFKLGLIGITLAFLGLTILVKIYPVLSIDLIITQAIQTINNPIFDSLMKFLSELGLALGQTLLPLVAVLVLWFFRQKREALTLAVSSYGSILISEAIKRVVARPRPDNTLILQIGNYVKHDSFPSGHVLFYIGFFGFLLFLTFTKLKKGWLRSLLMAIFSVLIILIGISRIYLGAHWFSDVLGSYLIGTIWLIIVIHIYHNLKGKLE